MFGSQVLSLKMWWYGLIWSWRGGNWGFPKVESAVNL